MNHPILIPCQYFRKGRNSEILQGLVLCSDDPYQKIDHPREKEIIASLPLQHLSFPIDCGDLVITMISEPLPQEKKESQEIEISFSPEKPYHRIPGSQYIFLPDGSVARLLKPTIVEGREYFNLIGIAPKARRVSRRWIRKQIQDSL